MRIATILPKPYLHLGQKDEYQMILAHIAARDEDYRSWYTPAASAAFRILDNGAAELGAGLDLDELVRMVKLVQPNEVVLPDYLGDAEKTLYLSHEAMQRMPIMLAGRRMAVPQGETKEEWRFCLREFLAWPGVTTIGLSRFVVNNGLWKDRAQLLEETPELVESGKEIHLLGSPGDPIEAYMVEQRFPGRVRGIDSGIAAIYTQAGKKLYLSEKPAIDLDFLGEDHDFDADLLLTNIVLWKNRVRYGGWL